MKKGYCSVTANLVTDRRKTPNLPNCKVREMKQGHCSVTAI